MTIKNKITLALLVAISPLYAQETPTNDVATIKSEIKISFLDSIKKTFVKDQMAMCIDSLWMKELTSLDGYNEMILDIKNVNVDEKVDFELPTELLKERLKRLDEKSPFNIEYNIGLENVIKSFLKNRKRGFERLMGISQFYFPIFEEELAKNNIPLEIKYLAVVESALNPKAVSRVGATGLWQFMYQTGKQYGINIDSYVDERSDPIIASQAASQYMTNMYRIFGDWDLVLASYNSGPGNVAKAIRRSGGQQNYWNIRKNLPKETQGYLPAFLATMYIFEYHKEHGIVPNKAVAKHFATDTIGIKKHLTFKQISDLLDISEAELQFFNPSYKRNEIPSIAGKINYLRLPKDKIAIFTSNEDKVYAYANYIDSKREKPYEKPYERFASVKQNDSTNTSFEGSELVSRTKYHKVRRGDNLSEISDKYGVTVAELKKWNRLKSNKAPLGRSLKIISTERIAYKDKKAPVKDTVAKSVENTQIASSETKNTIDALKADKKFTTEKVVTYKDVTKTYKVKSGDNISEIAAKNDVSVADIKKWNKLKSNNIMLGANLKIVKNEKVVTTVKKEVKSPVVVPNVIEQAKQKTEAVAMNDSKIETYYVVQKGDNLGSIARTHGVTIQQVKDWNNLIDTNVKLGTQLIISNQPLTQNNENQVASTQTKSIEHVVGKGEFLGTIARKYNVSINDLLEWNSLSDTNIKQGDKLIVGKEELVDNTKETKKAKKESYALTQKQKNKMYSVQRGDSLFSISKKFPGVTISDIKKWNNIKDESIQPGMKLKISG
ncbi:MAG: LysM peptidoglycan-binding domain-containing protein [Bacteroidota bacterium]